MFADARSENVNRYSSSTSFSRQAQGVSVLLEFLKRVKPFGVVVHKSATLDQNEFSRGDVFLALSPKSPYSAREARILKTFVENGGHLVISTESPQASANVEQLMKVFGLSETRKAFPDFVNRTTVSGRPAVARGPIPDTAPLEFYSRYGFPSDGGLNFVKEETVGDGTVTLMTGIPIFANAMIGRGQNWRAAHQLAMAQGRVVFDEYHHLFSEKSVWSLLREPYFALPVFGTVLVAILFFTFGRFGRADAWSEAPPAPHSRSFHDFGNSVFKGLARQSRAEDLGVQEHASFLRSLFPDASHQISKVAAEKGAWLARGAGLLQLHKRLLRERGWRE